MEELVQHATFSPSCLKRIIACPSSVKLYELFHPMEVESQYAAEGTLLHSYMEKIVQNTMSILDIPDAEHRTVCKQALEYIQSVTDGSNHLCEVRVRIKDTPVWGTSDLIVWNESEVHVLDYKFGEHVKVDAEDNPQFMAYMLGAIDTLHIQPTRKLYMHVVQPRLENYQRVEISYDKLIRWKNDVLVPAIAKAESDTDFFNPSEETCRWCQCKARCRAVYDKVQQAAADVFSTYNVAKEHGILSTEELVKFYEASDAILEQIKATKDYVLAELLRGNKIPGYKIKYTRGQRKWTDEVLAAQYLEKTYDADPDDMYVTSLRSVAQMEKVFPFIKKDNAFQNYIYKTDGNPTVVKDNGDAEESPFSGVAEKLQ